MIFTFWLISTGRWYFISTCKHVIHQDVVLTLEQVAVKRRFWYVGFVNLNLTLIRNLSWTAFNKLHFMLKITETINFRCAVWVVVGNITELLWTHPVPITRAVQIFQKRCVREVCTGSPHLTMEIGAGDSVTKQCDCKEWCHMTLLTIWW